MATLSSDDSDDDIGFAVSTRAMRSGRHYAEFTLLEQTACFGVTRHDFDFQAEGFLYNQPGHCFFDASDGSRYPSRITLPAVGSQETIVVDTSGDWDGFFSPDQGDRVGMLLDIDQGTMTGYVNGTRRGVMMTRLSSEHQWAAELDSLGCSVRVDSPPAPPSPTEEEVAAAEAWLSILCFQ